MQTEMIPWRQRDVVTIRAAAELLGCSRAQVYNLRKTHNLEFVLIGGRTLVRVEGLARLIDTAPAWTPRPYADKATATRVERSQRSAR